MTNLWVEQLFAITVSVATQRRVTHKCALSEQTLCLQAFVGRSRALVYRRTTVGTTRIGTVGLGTSCAIANVIGAHIFVVTLIVVLATSFLEIVDATSFRVTIADAAIKRASVVVVALL
jgi:hypothetical protein